MPTLVADCPRCDARLHTFDVLSHVKRLDIRQEVDWAKHAETFSVCRRCHKPTIFKLQVRSYELRSLYGRDEFWSSDATLNNVFDVLGYISLRETVSRRAPEHTPPDKANAFNEGAACLAIECYNAAGAMFRLCLDLATRELLPQPPEEGQQPKEGEPNRRQRRDLGLRLPWLIENNLLPPEIRDFAEIVREDGNDGAHAGNLTREDAEDLADFTELLLERLYTEPGRVENARARRAKRRERLGGGATA